ncbi:CsgG/HfaB family protein [Algoriphagus confluentis]
MKSELLELPPPSDPIYVAVYKFRDQTGQYKESNIGASWSTAVTQGATNILIRALEESGWFIPIERENISNLLNERKIIRSSREQYEGTTDILLPPLLFAGVLLEGGIISYETNIYTGGAGVRYFGADASARYREDRVSIYLRAVSTNNGKILKTIYTTKSILSQEVSAGFFRYVKFKRLLEAETGYTYSEPTEMAITEAVEKAVYSMIIEGVEDQLWNFKDTSDATQKVVADYNEEKKANIQIDYIGRMYDSNLRSNFFIGGLGTLQTYEGDYSSSPFTPGFRGEFGFGFTKSLFLKGGLGFQQIEVTDIFRSSDAFADVGLTYLGNPDGKISPYLGVSGGSYFDLQREGVGLSGRSWMPYVRYNAGVEFMVSNKTALVVDGFLNQLLNDSYDEVVSGSFNDMFWGVGVGLKFYIGNQSNNE